MNTPADPFSWGSNPLATRHWHQLHDLWIYLAPAEQEFTLSYCYGMQNLDPRWLQYSRLTDIRFPFAPRMEARQGLANRPMVARPMPAIHVPAGESVTLYVGTSLWLTLVQDEHTLVDIPVAFLSDTWFGPDTRRGELCFACQTHARLSMDGVATNPWKAITPVKVRNRADEALALDRINIPIPNLTLYGGQDRYWTSKVTITRRTGPAGGEIEVSREAPPECLSPVELAPPREPRSDSAWHKAADLLLGQDNTP